MVITRSGLHPEAQVLPSDANTDLDVHTEAAARGSYTNAHRITPSISFHHFRTPSSMLRFRRPIWNSLELYVSLWI